MGRPSLAWLFGVSFMLGAFGAPPLQAAGFVEIDARGLSAAKASPNQGNSSIFSNLSFSAGLLIGYNLGKGPMSIVFGGDVDVISYKPVSVGGTGLNELSYSAHAGPQLELKRLQFRFLGGLRQVGVLVGAASLSMNSVLSPWTGASMQWAILRGPGHDISLKVDGSYLFPAGTTTRVTGGFRLGLDVGIDLRFSGIPLAVMAGYHFQSLSTSAGPQTDAIMNFGIKLFIEAAVNAGGKPKSRYLFEN